MKMWSPLFSPQQQLFCFFKLTSFSMDANLSLFIFKWTSKHSPLFLPFLMVPVTVRNPFVDIWGTSLALSWVSSLCRSVMLTPCPPIGSDLVHSVLRISIASSLGLILKEQKYYFSHLFSQCNFHFVAILNGFLYLFKIFYLICSFGVLMLLSVLSVSVTAVLSPPGPGTWGRGLDWIVFTLSVSLFFSITEILSNSSVLVFVLGTRLEF